MTSGFYWCHSLLYQLAHGLIPVIETGFEVEQTLCFDLLSWEGCGTPRDLAVLAPCYSVGSTSQQARHHLGAHQRVWIWVPPDLLNQSLHFTRVPGWASWLWMFEKHCCSSPVRGRAGPFCHWSSLATGSKVPTQSLLLTSSYFNSVSPSYISFLIIIWHLSCFCAFFLPTKSLLGNLRMGNACLVTC